MSGTDSEPMKDSDLIDRAWAIITNVSEGDWSKQSNEWYQAVVLWRNDYHRALDVGLTAEVDRLRVERDALAAQLEAVRALHREAAANDFDDIAAASIGRALSEQDVTT